LEYERTTGFKPTDETAPVPWEQWTLSRDSPQAELVEPELAEPELELAEPEPEPELAEPEPGLAEPETEPAPESTNLVAKSTSAFQATVEKDIWALGALAFRLCVEDGAAMFLSNDADNLVKRSDLETVAYGWEYRKLEEIKQVAWPEAADLILKCMQTNEERRLPSFKDALSHPFLAVDESDQRPLYFPQPPHFRATEFHTAIQDGNTEAVRMQLDAGGVHLKMIDDSMSRSKAVELFEQADSDSSKSLSHDEAAQVATSLGLQLEPPQMQLALQVIDVDGNGRIDFEEFFEWYCDSLGESAVLPLARAAFRGCKDVM